MENTTSTLVTVTPEMADGWLATAMYERQRRRAEWHVKRLSLEIEKGRFIAGSQIHFGIINGEMRLVNGQHTLAAISRTGISVPLAVLRTVVRNEHEIGELYGRHDRHRGRTPHDAFLGMGLSGELQMEEVEVNAFSAGLKFVLAGLRRPSVHLHPEMASLDYLAGQMRAWSNTARTYFDCVRDARHGMKAAFRRSPVVAIGLVTIHAKEEQAKEFWAGAASDDGLHKHDPRRALNQFLATTTSGHGDPITYMRNIAGAWNKYFENGELQFLRPGDMGKIGVTVRGSKFKAVKPKAAKAAVDAVDEYETATTRMRQTSFGDAAERV